MSNIYEWKLIEEKQKENWVFKEVSENNIIILLLVLWAC